MFLCVRVCVCVMVSAVIFKEYASRTYAVFPYHICTWSFLRFFGKLFACSAIRLSMSRWKNHTLFLSLPILFFSIITTTVVFFCLSLAHASVLGYFSWDICLFYFVYNVVSADKLLLAVEPWCFWNVTHEVDICWCESSGMFEWLWLCVRILFIFI